MHHQTSPSTKHNFFHIQEHTAQKALILLMRYKPFFLSFLHTPYSSTIFNL